MGTAEIALEGARAEEEGEARTTCLVDGNEALLAGCRSSVVRWLLSGDAGTCLHPLAEADRLGVDTPLEHPVGEAPRHDLKHWLPFDLSDGTDDEASTSVAAAITGTPPSGFVPDAALGADNRLCGILGDAVLEESVLERGGDDEDKRIDAGAFSH